MGVPKKLSHFRVFLDGIDYISDCTSIDLPSLELKTEDYRGGGMDAPIAIEMGFESALEIGFVLAEYRPEVLASFGSREQGPINLHFLGHKKANHEQSSYQVIARGMLTSVEHGTAKSGEDTEMTCKMKLTYLRIMENLVTLCEIDVLNNQRIFGGVDQLSGVRKSLLL